MGNGLTAILERNIARLGFLEQNLRVGNLKPYIKDLFEAIDEVGSKWAYPYTASAITAFSEYVAAYAKSVQATSQRVSAALDYAMESALDKVLALVGMSWLWGKFSDSIDKIHKMDELPEMIRHLRILLLEDQHSEKKYVDYRIHPNGIFYYPIGPTRNGKGGDGIQVASFEKRPSGPTIVITDSAHWMLYGFREYFDFSIEKAYLLPKP